MADRTTSKKHDDFVRERMEDKAITELAGVGEKAAGHLESIGFVTAKQVLVSQILGCEDGAGSKE